MCWMWWRSQLFRCYSCLRYVIFHWNMSWSYNCCWCLSRTALRIAQVLMQIRLMEIGNEVNSEVTIDSVHLFIFSSNNPFAMISLIARTCITQNLKKFEKIGMVNIMRPVWGPAVTLSPYVILRATWTIYRALDGINIAYIMIIKN